MPFNFTPIFEVYYQRQHMGLDVRFDQQPRGIPAVRNALVPDVGSTRLCNTKAGISGLTWTPMFLNKRNLVVLLDP